MHYQQLRDYYQRFKSEYPKATITCKFVCITSCILAARHLYHACLSKYYQLAPGPKGFPLLGCLYQFIFRQKEFLSKLSKYGPVVSVPLGLQMVTIINDSTAWNDMLKQQSFVSHLRPVPFQKCAIHPGIACIDGDNDKERLSLMTKAFTDILKTQFIAKRTEIALYENDTFAKLDNLCASNTAWYPLQDLNLIAFNNIFAACFGVNLKQNDAFFAEFLKTHQQRMNHCNSKWLQFRLFFNQFSMFYGRQMNTLQELSNEQAALLADWMIASGGFEYDARSGELTRNKQHPLAWKRNRIRQENIIHFVDAVIKHNSTVRKQPTKKKKQKNDNAEENVKKSMIPLDTLIKDIISILSHGFMSTANALEYALLSLAKYPKVQERIYAELKRVMIVDHHKVQFTLDLVAECHLLRAFVAEALRIASIAPMGMICSNESGTDYVDRVRGHVIPMNGWLMPNFHAMNQNDNGSDFDIDRWLDEEGKFQQIDSRLMFGSAHRKCIGEKMALQTVYSVISMVLMRYRISTEKGDNVQIEQQWGWNQNVSPKIPITLQHRVNVIDLYSECHGQVMRNSVSLKNGKYFIYTFGGNTEQQLLWDVAANYKRNNGVIHQWKYHGGPNQQFYVELADEKNALYTIRGVQSGLYAQIKYESRYEFVELVIYEKQRTEDDKTQKFIMNCVDEAGQIYRIVNANSLMALGVQNESQRLHSKMLQCSSSQHASQLFKFVPVAKSE